jgi:hypothetical protein
MVAYDNPPVLVTTAIIVQLLATACVVLRIQSGRKLRTPFEASEWLIIGALGLSFALTVLEIYGVFVSIFISEEGLHESHFQFHISEYESK